MEMTEPQGQYRGKGVRESNGGERAALKINKSVLFSADFLAIVCLIHLPVA